MLRCTPPSQKIAISNPCRLAHAKFIRVVPSDGPRADAFPATMLTSENGIREFHSGPKYGRIEIGDHKLTKIDRGRDLTTGGSAGFWSTPGPFRPKPPAKPCSIFWAGGLVTPEPIDGLPSSTRPAF